MYTNKEVFVLIRFSTGEELQTGTIFGKQEMIRGAIREALEIHFDKDCTYEQLKGLFVDGAKFSVVETIMDENTGNITENVYPKNEYIMSGPITDNRDGSFIVYMGTLTENERLAEENAELLLMLVGGE